LTGEKVDVEHLRRLAKPLALAAGLPWAVDMLEVAGKSLVAPAVSAAAEQTDQIPFWGEGEGTVVFDVGEVVAGKRDYRNVGGTLEVGRRTIQLAHVRGREAQAHGASTPVLLDGQLNFDPGAAMPYQLKATGDLGVVDAATLVPAPKPLKSKRHEDETEEPMLEGHFTTAVTVTGSGRNLADLAARTQQEIKLTSQGGILRLLKVFIGDAFQEKPSSAMSDTVSGVGSLMGKLFAIKESGGEKKVSAITDDVLDLASQTAEIEFESFALTAVRGGDGSVRLTEFVLTGPTEKLTGTGTFEGGRDVPLTAKRLSLDLTLAGRGRTAELIAKAGLSSGQKDSLGYTNLQPTLHFGGSLENLDSTMWHDVLVKAATKPPAGAKAAAK
jgi:hypothetical protein